MMMIFIIIIIIIIISKNCDNSATFAAILSLAAMATTGVAAVVVGVAVGTVVEAVVEAVVGGVRRAVGGATRTMAPVSFCRLLMLQPPLPIRRPTTSPGTDIKTFKRLSPGPEKPSSRMRSKRQKRACLRCSSGGRFNGWYYW